MEHIPDIFKNNNTIYHYTKSQTAIEYILFDKQIRLSPRNRSNDPIESSKLSTGYGGIDLDENDENDAKKMLHELAKRESKLKQVCFCMNNIKKEPNEYEFYGFLKPRMWNQYGDNYKGVCLAFDKNELKKNKKIELKIESEINYLEFEDLKGSGTHIDANEIRKEGYDNCKNKWMEKQNEFFSRKHQDYRDENEYRICTFSENEYEDINIEKSIRGIIIIPKYVNNFILKNIAEYSEGMDLPLLYVNLNNNGLNIVLHTKGLNVKNNNGVVYYSS